MMIEKRKRLERILNIIASVMIALTTIQTTIHELHLATIPAIIPIIVIIVTTD